MKINSFFKNIRSIYFIGIGGISMSALAMICKSKGITVSGSDKSKNEQTRMLEKNGIKISYIQNEKNFQDYNLIVVTGAIDENNLELQSARKQQKRIITRADFLHQVSKWYDNVIAISGTHGKTTTCGMVAEILRKAKKNPTFHIGGVCNNFKSNFHMGEDEFFVTEACEYKKSMLSLSPGIGVVLNVEKDHMDCYENFEDLENAFKDFVKNSKKAVVSNAFLQSDNTIMIGNENNGFYVSNITANKNKGYKFKIFKNKKLFLVAKLNILGRHNINNALFAVAVCDELGISKKAMIKGLKNFNGVERRLEVLQKKRGQEIIRDYAHHPTEINCTIESIKEMKKNFIFIFQPHTYSRTKYLFKEFVNCLEKVDNLIIYKTYPAREKYIAGGGAKDLFLEVKKKNSSAKYVGTEIELQKTLKQLVENRENIIFVGAGDVGEIAKKVKL